MNAQQPSQAESLLSVSPLVAILRGLTAERAIEVGQALYTVGLRVIEVPLNSPQPFSSIEKLSQLFGGSCLCGAGTVLNAADVQRTFDAGGRLIVAPNTDSSVITAALSLGMLVMPGIATATEAFAAINAGASHLKLFPAASYGSRHLRALRSVLPAHVKVYPVGGVSADDIAEWRQAGAAGFGFGSELFMPGYSVADIALRAEKIMRAYQQLPA